MTTPGHQTGLELVKWVPWCHTSYEFQPAESNWQFSFYELSRFAVFVYWRKIAPLMCAACSKLFLERVATLQWKRGLQKVSNARQWDSEKRHVIFNMSEAWRGPKIFAEPWAIAVGLPAVLRRILRTLSPFLEVEDPERSQGLHVKGPWENLDMDTIRLGSSTYSPMCLDLCVLFNVISMKTLVCAVNLWSELQREHLSTKADVLIGWLST